MAIHAFTYWTSGQFVELHTTSKNKRVSLSHWWFESREQEKFIVLAHGQWAYARLVIDLRRWIGNYFNDESVITFREVKVIELDYSSNQIFVLTL